jgi:hypothetical protein
MTYHRDYKLLIYIEDNTGVIRICKSKKARQHNGQKKKRIRGEITIYKTLHIKPP